MNVLVVGGCGYIGAALVPELLRRGHRVTVYDSMYFGRGGLPECNWVICADLWDVTQLHPACEKAEAVILLASISAEEMCRRDPKKARSVNSLGAKLVSAVASHHPVKRFIYASSVAAYPPSEQPSKESDQMTPTTLYGEGKVDAEGFVRAELPNAVVVRSASVCGYSPRMRFDLTVNKMAHDAVRHGRVVVNGGEQKRSHIHIGDICDFYCRLLDVGMDRIAGQTFNAVAHNLSIQETAERVILALTDRRRAVNMPYIEVRERTDNRSYTVDGTKAREVLGFDPKRTIEEAAREIKARFDDGEWTDSLTNELYRNLMPA